jgi:hypothetical protein
MKILHNKKVCKTGLCLVLILFGSQILFYAGQSDEELKKKYAPILGEYEFDLSEMGMGTLTATFYVEDGSVWGLNDANPNPGELIPVEEKTFEFTLENPEEGMYIFTFVKDEDGKYTKVKVVNEEMGTDLLGKKIK